MAEPMGETREAIANAYIMAGAPDLLKACKALIREFGRNYDWPNMMCDPRYAAISSAKMAVAKAEGK
jgi:hypothetical protein